MEETLRGLETMNAGPFELRAKKTASWADIRVSTKLSGRRLVEVGQVLGKCVLTQKIGQGSSGLVFRARHQTLNITVAVKVLHVAGESQVYRQLKSEARYWLS